MMRRLSDRLRQNATVLRDAARLLWHDKRGNTFALIAAALIPMLAAIGSGVDISRAYMAQSRLQGAVDSAALAGRRSRIGSGMTEATEAANKFLAFNYPKTAYGGQESDWQSTVTPPDVNSVQVTASTRIPTTIMRFFGYQSIPISATSVAKQNWINTDILLVLDVTGSMGGSINGTPMMTALRNAVLDLYDELQEAQTNLEARGLRLRIGILPYSSSVNVGRLLRAEDSTYLRTPAKYFRCTTYETNKKGKITGCASGNEAEFDVSARIASNLQSQWAGCIEERDTVSSITTSSDYTIPSGALDQNIDLIPNNSASRWPPLLPAMVDTGTSVSSACPVEARLLQTWSSRANLSTYLDTLAPTGNTYHDLGMIWGARMISPNGVFPNPTEYAGAPVNRHIIFMTDGVMQPSDSVYSSYGIEEFQKRVSGGAGSLTARHNQRFLMACNAARGLNVPVWTVGFGTGTLSTLQNCTGSSDRSFNADNADELSEKFKEIGRSIGKLRIAE